ncbi:MAG: IPT/TIG domain-containing protein, partial [Actinobacteria bacterium]|nr:IPT/TIG domain-containing protein [Actinomycetota bacterium]
DPGYGTDGLPVAGYPANQTFTIHYNRPDGNYGDWNIWMWGTGTALDTGHDFTGTDAYGVYTTLDVPGDNDSLVSGFGYLLRSTHDWSNASKNTNDNYGNQVAVDNVAIPDGGQTAGLTEIWVKQGDATSYTSNPFPVPHVGAVAATAKAGEAVAIAGTGLTGASSVTLVRAAVPAVTATKVGNAWKCGSTTRSQGYVCTAAVPAATATAAAKVVSSTKIVAAFPNSGAITGKIVVSNPAGTSTSAGNLALSATKSAPKISTSTAKGVIGDTVTVTGTNVGAATGVKLGTLDISDFAVTDVNSLTFVVPAGATDSKISVTTAAGTATAAKAFALVPSISSVSSSAAIGGTVTVTGVNLGAASAVKLGTKAITGFTKGATSISFTVPTGSVTGTVTVTTPGGVVTSADSVTVIQKPTVTSVTGAKTGTKFNKGATLTITGANLSGATSVLIGASAVTGFTVVDSTHITFTAPTNKVGKVSVITPGGTGTSSASITTTS